MMSSLPIRMMSTLFPSSRNIAIDSLPMRRGDVLVVDRFPAADQTVQISDETRPRAGLESHSDRKGPPRRDDGRSAERPQRSLDHQSAQACLGTGCGPLHGREPILSGIRGH